MGGGATIVGVKNRAPTAEAMGHPIILELRMRVWTLVLVCTGLVGVCFGEDVKPAAGARFEISKETTFVTEPVRADGTIDYVEAINAQLSKGATKENNSA